MIRGTRPQQSGFTVIEVIVFLSVSIALVASAIALFSTRIPRTQFAQSVNELDIKLKSVGNDVLNGFYPNPGNFQCSGGAASTGGSNAQGENAECIYLGRAIQFGEEDCSSNECDQFRIYTVYGRRVLGDNIVNNLQDAAPRITNIGVETYTTGFGLHLTKVLTNDTNGVAYLSTFGSRPSGLVAQAPAGASQVELRSLKIGSGNFGLPTDQFGNNTIIFNSLGPANPSNGITLCLRSGTSNQFATITLGESGRPLSNTVAILTPDEWRSSPCA